MKLVSAIKNGESISETLSLLEKEVNNKLKDEYGVIKNMYADMEVGVEKSSIRTILLISEEDDAEKYVVGVNARGINEEQSLHNAVELANKKLRGVRGKIVGYYHNSVSTLPLVQGRCYTTMIFAINEEHPGNVLPVPAKRRRERLRVAIELLGGDPQVVNISRVAKAFSVSRDVIYNDLGKIGLQREASTTQNSNGPRFG